MINENDKKSLLSIDDLIYEIGNKRVAELNNEKIISLLKKETEKNVIESKKLKDENFSFQNSNSLLQNSNNIYSEKNKELIVVINQSRIQKGKDEKIIEELTLQKGKDEKIIEELTLQKGKDEKIIESYKKINKKERKK